jgi:hypothetical protein
MQTILTGLALVALLYTSPCFAQTASNRVDPIRERAPGIIAADKHDSSRNSGPILINNVNIKAARDFMRYFEKATDVTWTVVSDGFLAHCYCEGIQTRIFYDAKGNREFVCRSYGENKLPHEIRHLVRSNYYDYSIFCVNEVTAGEQTVYFVKITNVAEWKTLRVEDNEIYVTEEFRKG